MFKQVVKRFLLKKKGIVIDFKSQINLSVRRLNSSGEEIKIINSKLHLTNVDEGVSIENVFCYGDISIGRFTSISGPGTILHAEVNSIKIGAFTSIAQNVSIQEFNHNHNRPTTFAINHSIFKTSFKDDAVSKGSILIEDDVWIGSNVTLLSGVTIGRGSIIGAGTVVTKNIPRYSIAVGNPAKIIKKRFVDEVIEFLEALKWWEWDLNKIRKNHIFFSSDLNEMTISEVQDIIV
ncbi:CatB-related O-acetyltransferase [Fusibacter sp. 3D3]|uniref:CatB-related O-acetyltransferase n=1 Tax=Fusibacter sp. 3D3 TaxID=1048380 RepID=UPI000857C1DA|nr:CatB-related O-acetyltransferase [Fusibacter sp. 3D3]GAU77781.1 maltose O-acetyltransferase [Fusibacter sp. 3D3]